MVLSISWRSLSLMLSVTASEAALILSTQRASSMSFGRESRFAVEIADRESGIVAKSREHSAGESRTVNRLMPGSIA